MNHVLCLISCTLCRTSAAPYEPLRLSETRNHLWRRGARRSQALWDGFEGLNLNILSFMGSPVVQTAFQTVFLDLWKRICKAICICFIYIYIHFHFLTGLHTFKHTMSYSLHQVCTFEDVDWFWSFEGRLLVAHGMGSQCECHLPDPFGNRLWHAAGKGSRPSGREIQSHLCEAHLQTLRVQTKLNTNSMLRSLEVPWGALLSSC